MHPKKVFAMIYCPVVICLLILGGRSGCDSFKTWLNKPSAFEARQMENTELRRIMEKYRDLSDKEDKPISHYRDRMNREIASIKEVIKEMRE